MEGSRASAASPVVHPSPGIPPDRPYGTPGRSRDCWPAACSPEVPTSGPPRSSDRDGPSPVSTVFRRSKMAPGRCRRVDSGGARGRDREERGRSLLAGPVGVAGAAARAKQVLEQVVQGLKIRDLAVDLRDLGFDSGAQVAAGDGTRGASSEEIVDLGETQAELLCLLDRADPLHGSVWVVAIAGPIARRRRQKPKSLVVPKGLRMNAAGGGELAATHRGILPLSA